MESMKCLIFLPSIYYSMLVNTQKQFHREGNFPDARERGNNC